MFIITITYIFTLSICPSSPSQSLFSIKVEDTRSKTSDQVCAHPCLALPFDSLSMMVCSRCEGSSICVPFSFVNLHTLHQRKLQEENDYLREAMALLSARFSSMQRVVEHHEQACARSVPLAEGVLGRNDSGSSQQYAALLHA